MKIRGNIFKYQLLGLVLIVISFFIYYQIGYVVPRSNFDHFISLYLLLFGLFLLIYKFSEVFSFKQLLLFAILLRLLFLYAIPELSNDFYRFLWDGELILKGINPYAHTPNELISFSGFFNEPYMRTLYHGMGELSQEHYSCYPPVNQLFFLIAASFPGTVTGKLIVLKLLLILADVGVIILGKKILNHLQLNQQRIWLYGLNPLIILEFSANVHFEGVMLLFILCSLYLLMLDKWLSAAFFMGVAVYVKLIPLILIPLVFKKLGWKRTLGYLAMLSIVLLLLGKIFFTPQFLNNMLLSVNSYFTRFEFNAGIYYLIREIGFWYKGYNVIETIGPLLSISTFFLILFLSFFRSYQTHRDLFTTALFVLVIYYALATTVHPWYISSILLFSVFTVYQFGVIWSCLVMLSYAAYQHPEFKEDGFLLTSQYVMFTFVLIYEIYKNRKKGLVAIQIDQFFSNLNNDRNSNSYSDKPKKN